MQRYANVVNGAVVSAFILPPNKLDTPEGLIVNFNQLSQADLAAHGYYAITDSRPNGGAWQQRGPDLYAISGITVVVTADLTDLPILDFKQTSIKKVYEKAKQLLDIQAEGYGLAEIAAWPAIQADVVAYNLDNTTIGSALQTAAGASSYDAAGIAALITPRIAVQSDVLANRKALVEAISTALDHQAVAGIDITAGW